MGRPAPADGGGPQASGATRAPARWVIRRWPAVLAVVATAVALAPVAVVVATWVGRDHVPVQDLAITDLRVRDVWSRHVPLVGPYSKGWSHPGPLLFWLLAVPSGLTGQASWSTVVGGALLQGVAVAATAAVAWRRAGLPLVLLVLAVLGLSYGSAGGFGVLATGRWLLIGAWNPQVAFPFFVLLVLLLWAVADGGTGSLVAATVVGSFLVQTHAGYAPLVALPGLAVAALVVLDARRTGTPPARWRRAGLWSAGLAVLLWLPSAIEQVIGPYGNLKRMYDYFANGQGEPAGFVVAGGVLAEEFTLPPPWLGGEHRRDVFTNSVEPASLLWLLVPAALLGLGFLAARRSGRRSDLHLVVLLTVLLGAGVLSVSRVPDRIEPYLFLWRTPLALLVVGGVGWAVAHALPLRLRRWRPAPLVPLVALGAVVAVAWTSTAVDTSRAPRPLSGAERTTEDVLDQLAERGEPSAPVILRTRGGNVAGIWGALVNELDRRGAPVRVDRRRDFQFGRHRTAEPEDVRAVWYVVEEGYLTSYLSGLPGAEVVARTTPLGPEQEREATALQRRLADVLLEEGERRVLPALDTTILGFAAGDVPGVDGADVERLVELNEQVRASGECRCSVVALPPEAPVNRRTSP